MILRLKNVMRNRHIHLDLREVQAACDQMNQYCKAKIVYPMTEEVVVDASVMSGWLTVDDKMQVTISEDAVRKWLEEFGVKYDTMGTTRTFTTPARKRGNGKWRNIWMVDQRDRRV